MAKENQKTKQLSQDFESDSETLTTNFGLPVNDNQNTLKAGVRGPSLIEDMIFREKITHFDHERIPERVVHARGFGAHGIFELYEPLAELTCASFLTDTKVKTPVFVRFSTVAGSRGSTDLARDVRGFAVRFFTPQGNFDLVGNNIPVFFIQDAMKFPDLIHAVKPEPHNEIPQAASAHDTFWDFISLMPESMHMIMWVMSDRAIPRSYRTMEGFGVHTFRLVNAEGKSTFCKFHWKPKLGVHSVTWDEALKISGKDPDFHRRDLWECIEKGAFPEWELGLQLVPEEDEHKFDFDLLDATKLIPEELVPVQRVGKMTLNRNVDNFFAETEQVAFHLGNIVPGIDFTNDPLLQGRLFSYLDTQLLRLGGPNFHEIPINRPLADSRNNQRDGFGRQTINRGRVSYHPNSLGGGCPFQALWSEGGFVSHAQPVEGTKIRERSESFRDHFSQARMFWLSMSVPEQNHIVNALQFELGKCEMVEIRQRMVGMLSKVDSELAKRVATGLGLKVVELKPPINHGVPAGADPELYEPLPARDDVEPSTALSLVSNEPAGIEGRNFAILLSDGFDDEGFLAVKKAIESARGVASVVAPRLGELTGANGGVVPIDFSLATCGSVLFDGVLVGCGSDSVATLAGDGRAILFVTEAYKHCKAVGSWGKGRSLLEATAFGAALESDDDPALVVGAKPGPTVKAFLAAASRHRNWDREAKALNLPV